VTLMRTLLVLLLAFLIGGGAAHAEKRPRVAILELNITGDAEPEVRIQLDKSLSGGLYAAGFDVVPRADVTAKLRKTPQLVGCVTTTCLEQLENIVGATENIVGATEFVRARVDTSGASYAIELELLGAASPDGIIGRAEASCPVCTLGEVNDAMSRAALKLRERDTKVSVRVVSEPTGATIALGETLLGVTPLEVKLPRGTHTLRATLPGYDPSEQTLDVSDGKGREVSLRLVAPPGKQPDVVPPLVPVEKRSYRVLKWATAGAALASLVAGVVLISLDGDPTTCDVPGAPCREVWSTMGAGVGLTLVGVGLGVTAGWMFLQDARVTPVPGGAVVGALLRF
jgi:hypothetical protein